MHEIGKLRLTMAALLLMSVAVSSFGTAIAAVPGLISYQGRVTTSTGEPVPDGPFFIRFQIYDAPVGGVALWNSGIQLVQVTNGLYSYNLGQDAPFPNGLFSGSNRWLGITVGLDPELTPRKQLVATGYAFVSQNADSVDWGGIKNVPASLADGTVATLTADQSFSGNNSFSELLAVGDSTLRVNNTGITVGRDQLPNSTSALSLYRNLNESTARHGLYSNINNASTGAIRGIYARAQGSASPSTGVFGEAYSDNDFRVGVRGYAEPINIGIQTGESIGLLGEAWYGAFGIGTRAVANFSYNTIGVWAVARQAQLSGYAIYCKADSNTNAGYAVRAESRGNGTGGYALHGICEGNSGMVRAVHGASSNNSSTAYGVYGSSLNNTGTGYGVYGTASGNSTANWAGYFNGDVNVTGTIFTPAKMTRIDHPLDPENRFLVHNTVESSELTNMYSGNAVLDDHGEATIILPDWFESANGDFRYQLTCIGGYAPVYIAERIADNRFKIAGGSSNLEVSWQVVAVRVDQYARRNPIVPERAKLPHERGKYIHPDAFGLNEELAIDFGDRRQPDPAPELNLPSQQKENE